MNQCFEAIAQQGIAPVISLSDPAKAVSLARAVLAGGVSNLEITLRTEQALSCITAIKKEFPGMCVSAGTVLRTEQAALAVQAGADYVVSPGFSPELVSYCLEHGIAIIPGCTSASEIDAAMRMGLRVLKYFPAEPLGGVTALELLAGPYRDVRFLPTGGISFGNLERYLQSKAVIACGGSYMAKGDLIARGAWEEITRNCRRAMDLSLGFRLAHVGLNCPDEQAASETAGQIADLFRLPVRPTGKSVFAGTAVECMKSRYLGTNGHVGLCTNSAARAESYFRRRGIAILEETRKYDETGRLKYFYLRDEIGGFAFHVLEP